MQNLSATQLLNMLSGAMLANEANVSQAYSLKEAGMKYQNWWANNTVKDVLTWGSSNPSRTGNSGFSVGIVQFDLANAGLVAQRIAGAIRDAAVSSGSLTAQQGEDLYSALTTFKAINLAGYPSAAVFRQTNSDYSPDIMEQAEQSFAIIVANRNLVNNLLQSDATVRSVLQNETVSWLGNTLNKAQTAMQGLQATLAQSGSSSSLIDSYHDQLVVVFGDMINQLNGCSAATTWIKNHPNATWAEFVAADHRQNGSTRDTHIADLFAQLTSGTISADVNPISSLSTPQSPPQTSSIENHSATDSLLLSGLFGALQEARVSGGAQVSDSQRAGLVAAGLQEFMAIQPNFESALITPLVVQDGNSVQVSTGDPITATMTFSC